MHVFQDPKYAQAAAIGATQVLGAGATGEQPPAGSKFSRFASKYSIAGRMASREGRMGAFGKYLQGGGGARLGIASMLAPMALNMVPNKIGGKDVSGVKNIMGSVSSVVGMASFIPGAQAFLPEIAIGAALFGGIKWAFGRADAARKKFEQGVRDTYSKIDKDPDQFISKIEKQVEYQDGAVNSYNKLSIYGKVYGDTLLKNLNGMANGTIKGKQLTTVMNGIAKTTQQGTIQWNALKLAIKNAGDAKLDGLAVQIEKVYGKTTMATLAMTRLAAMAGAGIDTTAFVSQNGAKSIMDTKFMDKYINNQIGALNDQIAQLQHPANAAGASNDAKQKALTKQIKAQEVIKKNLEDQLKTMQDQAKTIQQQNDYYNKQTDLTQQIKQAEISGNYIQAAQLRTVQQQQTSQYKQQQAIDAKQAQVDAQNKTLDALNAQLQALKDIQSAAEATSANTAQIKSLKDQIGQLKDLKTQIDMPLPKVDATHPLPVTISTFNPKNGTSSLAGGSTGTVQLGDLQKSGTKQVSVMGARGPQNTYVGATFVGKDGKAYTVGNEVYPGTGTYFITPVAKKAMGGPISGMGTWTSDSIPAMLSHGEFVMQAGAVNKYGLGMMYALNNKMYNVPGQNSSAVHGGGAGQTINFYINGSTDPQAVANMVMAKLKTVNAKTNKTNMVIK